MDGLHGRRTAGGRILTGVTIGGTVAASNWLLRLWYLQAWAVGESSSGGRLPWSDYISYWALLAGVALLRVVVGFLAGQFGIAAGALGFSIVYPAA